MTAFLSESPETETIIPEPRPEVCAFCLHPILPGEEPVSLNGQKLHAGGHFTAFRGRMEKMRIGGGL